MCFLLGWVLGGLGVILMYLWSSLELAVVFLVFIKVFLFFVKVVGVGIGWSRDYFMV